MTKINVAIVDDNEKMVSLLDAILQTDKNIEVIGRGDDGVQALDIIKNQEPDVVLLDLIMPKLDGLEVMQQVNKDMSLKKRPAFIVISAIGKENITENAFNLGAMYYIMKPFENDMILRRIHQVTESTDFTAGPYTEEQTNRLYDRIQGKESGNRCDQHYS